MRPWWLRWDGLPPSMERRAVEANRRAAGATGWRRLFAGGTLWAPAALGIAQARRRTEVQP